MSTDFRALCAELIAIFDAYSKDSNLLGIYDDLRVNGESVIDRARAALAADGPAVPEGREPASVVDQPSDEEIIQEAIKADLVYRPIDDGSHVFSVFVESHALNTYVLSFARAVLARWGRHDPPAEGAPCPSMEDVGPLIAWLAEQACQAADASQSTDAGMLTWAAQVISERVNEDAPDPPAEGEVAELVAWLRETGDSIQPSHLAEHQKYKRAADLLAQRHPEPVRLQQLESLAADAVSALRYIEQHHGRLYGVGWDRVFSEAAKLQSAPVLVLPEDITTIKPGEQTILVPAQAPVPVAERLPGPGDCDAEGRCWVGHWCDVDGDALFCWELDRPGALTWKGIKEMDGWLPFHALPLPAGEVGHG